MEQKIEHLRKFKKSVRLIPVSEVKDIGVDLIPNSWREIFQENDVEIKASRFLSI